jgi:ABC-type bacteriocin/lantibiotic exporter with double-glycine peptidase domain
MRWTRLFSSASGRPGDGIHRRLVRLVVALGAHTRRPLAAGLAVALAASALALVPPILLARVVDGAVVSHDGTTIPWIFAALCGVALTDGALLLVRRRIVVRTQTALRLRFAQSHLGQLFRLPIARFQESDHGMLIRSFDDLDRALDVATETVIDLATNALLVIVFAVLMLRTSGRMGAVVLASIAGSLVTAVVLGRFGRAAFGEWMTVRDRRLGHIVDTVTAMLTLKINTAERIIRRRFRHEQHMENAAYAAMETRAALAEGAVRSWALLTNALTASIGGYLVVTSSITAGQFVLFLAIASMLAAPAFALASRWDSLQHALVSVERLFEIARFETEPSARPTASASPSASPFTGKISVDSLSFHHASNPANVLLSASMRIAAGEHVALVGRSGAGKTTLAHLLFGLHEPDAGSISFDDKTIAQHGLAAVRENVGLVLYSTDLFAMSVRENISLGRPDAAHAEVVEAAELACLHEFVLTLPEGYDTRLGSGGVDLSAGQRQRLALARAILRAPKILILDEATAALDAATEAIVIANVRRRFAGRTMVVITHKADLAAQLTRVLTLVDGRFEAKASGRSAAA